MIFSLGVLSRWVRAALRGRILNTPSRCVLRQMSEHVLCSRRICCGWEGRKRRRALVMTLLDTKMWNCIPCIRSWKWYAIGRNVPILAICGSTLWINLRLCNFCSHLLPGNVHKTRCICCNALSCLHCERHSLQDTSCEGQTLLKLLVLCQTFPGWGCVSPDPEQLWKNGSS